MVFDFKFELGLFFEIGLFEVLLFCSDLATQPASVWSVFIPNKKKCKIGIIPSFLPR